MSLPLGCTETIAKYHFHYLSELFRYKKIRYTKKKPDIVMEQEYFNALCKRIKDTGHIDSFKQFVDFITNEES
ncbi:MAG: hypothetical protein K2O52_04050 [Oscillospiraceae bacterium]|nr:hypothetical protein [Oscillospiraceae bacterium]